MMHNFSNKDLLESFLEFERKNDLLELRYNGIYFWRLVRLDLIAKLSQTISESQGFKSNLKKKIVPILMDAVKLSNNFHKVNSYEIERIVITRGRSYVSEGNRFDLFLQNEIEKNNTLVVHSVSSGNRTSLHPNKVILEDFFFLFWRSIYHLSKKLRLIDKRKLIEIEKIFNLHFGVEFKIANLIIKNLLLFKFDIKIYSRLLEKIKPKEIVLTTHYGSAKALIYLTNKMGIKVIEYQHGLIYEAHLAYHFPGQNSAPYYPDELVLYGEYWRNKFLPPKNTKIRVKPNAYYQKRINEIRHSNENYQFDILAISNDYALNELIMDFAKSHLELKILLKLHPGSNGLLNVQGVHYLSYNEATNLEIIYNEYDLYDCISLCKKAIGTNSTGIFESVASGRETFVLKPTLQPKIFTDLISDGYAVGLNNLEEIINQRTKSSNKDLSIFFG